MNEEMYKLFKMHYPDLEPEDTVYCPYRVCPLGAHVDHQHGLITGFALDKGITMLYCASEEGIVEIASANFEGKMRFTVSSDPHRHSDWGDYARAAMKSLFEHGYEPKYGFSALVSGSLPIGGLSSSAAVVLTYIAAFCRVNKFKPTANELINMALWAEQRFIGLNIGKLDQSCEVYCKKDMLLYLDTLSGDYKNIQKNSAMPEYLIAIFFSGVSRALVNSAYNARVDECKSAAYALKAYAGIPYERINDTYLRDVPVDVFRAYANRLPDNFRKRAEHFYSENARVKKGVEAWEKGDIKGFGQAIFESGNSSIYNYESGSAELRALHEIMLDTPGIYGGRFSGAGFKGCCMAITNPQYTEQIQQTVTEKYLSAFPDMRDKFSVHFCRTADGINI